jgi:indole-3-glycerol phosphate synthase
MTNEEVERALEFVVKQQAQFSTDLQRLERNLSTTVDLLSEVSKTQLRMAEAQIRTESRVAELAEAQKRTNDTLAETNDRLNSLIVVVERYFSNGRRDN